jgi:hypothetical protein
MTPPRKLPILLAIATAMSAVGIGPAGATSNGAWIQLAPFVQSPRSEHGAIYDTLRSRLIVFGGVGAGGYQNDVFALDLCGGTGDPHSWDNVSTVGTPPSPRRDAAVIYDAPRDRIVVFGGRTTSLLNALNDTYALTLSGEPTWSSLPPFPFYGGGADRPGAYDPVRQRLVVVDADYGVFALTLNGTPTWSQLTPLPAPGIGIYGATLIYDPFNDRLVAFGGWTPNNSPNTHFNNAAEFRFATNTWAAIAATNKPGIRAYASVALDWRRKRMVVFGGYWETTAGNGRYNDCWSLPLTGAPGWSQLSPAGTPPTARSGVAAIYYGQRDQMALVGGYDGSFYPADVTAVEFRDEGSWTSLAPFTQSPRNQPGAIYDPVRKRMLLFGGQVGAAYSNEVWAKSLQDGSLWTLLTTAGPPPSPRRNACVTYDSARDRLVVFGGRTNSIFSRLDDTYALTLSGTPTWSALPSHTFPCAPEVDRFGEYDPVRDQLVVVDPGCGVFALRFSDLTWTQLAGMSFPNLGTFGYSVVRDAVGDRLILFGGVIPNGFYPPFDYYVNRTYVFNLATNLGGDLLAGNAPPVRGYHAAVYDPLRRAMVVFAGRNQQGLNTVYLGDSWLLPLDGVPCWIPLAPGGTPPGVRAGHTAIYDPVADALMSATGFNGMANLTDVPELVFPDIRPPAAVTNLAVTLRGKTTICLQWTAPGDDGNNGTAAQYDLRYSTSFINESNFASLPAVFVYDPQPAGAIEIATATGLQACRNYYFALKTIDEAGNVSAISNVPSGQTKCSGVSYFCDLFGPMARDESGDRAEEARTQLVAPKPNPAAAAVQLEFSIAAEDARSPYELSVFDLAGRLVRRIEEGNAEPGSRIGSWDLRTTEGSRVRSGMYFVRLRVGPLTQSRSVLVLP